MKSLYTDICYGLLFVGSSDCGLCMGGFGPLKSWIPRYILFSLGFAVTNDFIARSEFKVLIIYRETTLHAGLYYRYIIL